MKTKMFALASLSIVAIGVSAGAAVPVEARQAIDPPHHGVHRSHVAGVGHHGPSLTSRLAGAVPPTRSIPPTPPLGRVAAPRMIDNAADPRGVWTSGGTAAF